MLDSALATVTVACHLAFIVFVLGGALLVQRRPKLAFLHVPAALWGAFVELSGRVCPLTPLENWLRARAGEAGYAEGFLEHYLVAVVYPSGLGRELQVAFGVLAVLINVALYGLLLRRRHRGP